MKLLWKLTISMAMIGATAHGAEVQVAVGGDFTGPMELIAPAFEQATGFGKKRPGVLSAR